MNEADRRHHLWRRPSVFIAAALMVAAGLSMVVPSTAALATPAPAPSTSAPSSLCDGTGYTYSTAQFGPNVCVFTPPSGSPTTMAAEQTDIQNVLNTIAAQQVPLSAQFNDNGYALLFEPGTYGSATTPLVFEVGYYTEVAGLGAVPQDTTINGQIDVFPNALDSETQCTLDPTTGNCAGPGTKCGLPAGQTCYWANSTVNFWRSLSNLELNVVTNGNPALVPKPLSMSSPINDGNCFGGSTDFWSVSQATPVRSVIINGNLNFQSYCSETNYNSNNYGSGSYVANSEINGQLDWSGNQQGIARNSDFDSAAGYVWNYVYSGDGCPPGYTPPTGTACSPNQDAFGSNPAGTEGVTGVDQVTELPQSPVTEEEPFLYTTSSGGWDAFVPAVQQNSAGPNFLSGSEAGASVPLSGFFIANPATPEGQIQAALDHGQSLILTPGAYNLNAALVVRGPGSIIGLGFPALVPQHGNAALVVTPNSGVKLSGIIFDAGPVNSPVLLSVGTARQQGRQGQQGQQGQQNEQGQPGSSGANPDLVQDIFFRIGGAETTPVSATVSLIDNANNSIIDDVWAWRADHGANMSVTGPQGQVGAGWTYNQGATGLEVTGNNVTAYGLAIEHYQKNEVVWSGDNGTEIFFQNELPYDPPSQTAWEASPIQTGYPSFLVTNNVQNFHGYGMGSYVVFIYTNATLWDATTYEAPNNPGVVFTDAMDLFISSTCSVNGNCPTPSQSGGLESVIDGVGGPATNANPTAVVDVDSYANGLATLP